MRRLAVLLVFATAVGIASPASSATPGPARYRPPTFACQTVHHYGNGKAPNPLSMKDDPLCVVYNKRDITVDNGGAIRFLLAEPARFAVAGKCQYWQRDHWRIRIDRGMRPLVKWDGSYWWDLHKGIGGAILRHFRIAGQPVGAAQAAAAVATISPGMARLIRQYGGKRSGGGATLVLPAPLPC
jgi:hypothetical protein